MIKSRTLLHPLFSNPRSRFLLIAFFLTIAAASAFLWWRIIGILGEAGITRAFFYSPKTVPLLSYLLLPYVQVGVVLLSVLIAATTTAVSIVGPVKRLEQWLMDWDMGFSMSPLQSRIGDPYDNLIRLINDLYQIKKPAGSPKKQPEPKEALEPTPLS